MDLAAWIGRFPVLEVYGERSRSITHIVVDSREATPGSLFVAIAGHAQDGHHFMRDAIERGAVCVVSTAPLNTLINGVTYVRVASGPAALSHLAKTFYPSDGLSLVGVTGTNGKTTTTFLIRAILRAAGLRTGLLGTIEYDLGDECKKAVHTTPPTLSLHKMLSQIRRAGVSHAVMEVSSHAIHQGRVLDCRFATSVFTNLTRDHLDEHLTMEAYFASKRQLFCQTVGPYIVNIDDPWGRQLKQERPAMTWGYGLSAEKGVLYPKSLTIGHDGIRMNMATPKGDMPIVSPLVGQYNAYNIMAAVGVAIALNLPTEAITRGIADMANVPGRFERIQRGQDFLVIVDYAHTDDALTRLLVAVTELSVRRIITVFGCGGDRDRGKRPKMGVVAARLSHAVILTNDNPRSEPPQSILKEIEAGIRSVNPSFPYEIIEDREAAIARAIEMAQEGDAVVIAGKGHETDQTVGDTRYPFDDRAVAASLLTKRVGAMNVVC